jgi:hypothetical protein
MTAPRARLVAADTYAAIPARLRRQAARQEVPVPATITALARILPRASTAASSREPVVHEQASATRSPWMPAASPPAISVDALTSQVIQQLDRRLVAYRERMGRV